MNWIPPGMANMLIAKAQLWKGNNILIYRGMIMGISHFFIAMNWPVQYFFVIVLSTQFFLPADMRNSSLVYR